MSDLQRSISRLSIHRQHVAAARQGSQGRPAGRSQGSPDVANGLDERVFCDHTVRPDMVQDLVLANQPSGMCRKQLKHQPGAWAQRDDVAALVEQQFPGEIHRPVADNDRMLLHQ